MELELEIRKAAENEIRGALAEVPLEKAALVVRGGGDEECCTVGFDVLLVERKEIPAEGYRLVGSQNGWPVYVEAGLVPPDPSRLVINVDRVNERLAAIFLGK
ncbi:MAG TPA: hypothetical protein VGB25_08955 [Candidatus Binatia bacterium]